MSKPQDAGVSGVKNRGFTASRQWKYVHLRRFSMFIEESMYRDTQWVPFEPNDEDTLQLNVGDFLSTKRHRGTSAGKALEEAYFVSGEAGWVG